MKKTNLLMTVAFLLCNITFSHAQKYVGGDLSVLLKYEEQKATYLDKDGKTISNVLTFVKEQGWNTVRVRLFADPSKDTDKNVCQDIEYVKSLGKRIKEAGLYFMLDFHYSDTWADPGQQDTPNSWKMVNTPAFEYIYTYTKTNLEALITAGATPDLIQIGNEISFGMLWDGCKVSANSDWTAYEDTNWDSFSTALKNASKACRELCPEAKIIIHTEQCANNPTLDVAFFKRIQQYEIDYDIIGTSYYPYFKGPLSNLDKGLSELETNFPDKQIQIVETGYPSKWEVPGTSYDYTKAYPYSHEGQRKYTADLITTLKKHQQVNGLSWWYAEANAKGCTGDLKDGWYNASLFDNETGKALPALYELKNFNDGSTDIRTIPSIKELEDVWYNLDGRRLTDKPQQKGIYINKGEKVVVK
jgi:arabinogalactan endo-1,4-beta-galactosidase